LWGDSGQEEMLQELEPRNASTPLPFPPKEFFDVSGTLQILTSRSFRKVAILI
jgi:hypothetical protein